MAAEVARVPEELDEPLGRLAGVLAGDPRVAAALLGEVAVLARGRRAHREDGPDGNGGHDDLGEDRRELLVRRFLRRRPAPACAAAEPTNPSAPNGATEPAPGPAPEDVTVRLAGLDPLPRAVLVLRHGEHLTLAELARVTDRPPGAVTRVLAAAETAVAAEPHEIEQVLWRAPVPGPGAVAAAERRFEARRRRSRARLGLAAAAALVLVVGAAVLPGLLRPDPYSRAYGEWTLAMSIGDGAGFHVDGHQLSADEEVVGVTRVGDEGATCSVTVTTATRRVDVPPGRAAAVGRRPARFVGATERTDSGLWWSVGPRTSALAQCEGEGAAPDPLLLTLAGAVRFGPTPVRVPFDLHTLPAADVVHTYLDYAGAVGVLVVPRGQSEESGEAVFVGLVAPSSAGAVSGRRVDVNGRPGRLADDEDGTTVCWPSGQRTSCASMINQESSVGHSSPSRRARVLRTARLVRLAADLDDPATWFDAGSALPR